MIKIILTLLILIGCERNDMATMAINNDLTVINTNIVDTVPLYNSALEYEDDTLVRLFGGTDVYRVINLPTSEAMKIVGVTMPMCPLGTTTTEVHNYEVMTWDGESTTSTDKCCFYPEYGWRDFTITADPTKNTDLYDYYTVDVSQYEVGVIDCSKGDLVKSFTFQAKVYHSYEDCPRFGYFILGDKLIWRRMLDDKKLEYVRKLDTFLPFDDRNTSCAKADNIMTYTVASAKHFNSFTLAGVKAEHLNYIVKDTNGNVIKCGDIEVDAWLDDGHLLEQGTVTLLVGLDTIAEAGSTIEITLTNDGEVWLGFFSSSISVDSGVTTFSIQNGGEDYNDYTPDAWGNIPEAVKAKTRIFSIVVLAKYSEYDKINRLLLSMLGKFITIDGTDSNIVRDSNTLDSLTARGIITSVQADTVVKDGDLQDYIEYNLSFLEIV